MFLPNTLLISFKFKLGIKEALEIKVFKERFTPGAIIPPRYFFLITTSKVVAVPKSTIIKLFLLSQTLIAFARRSDPICFLFTLIFIILLRFISLSSIDLTLIAFIKKD